ncbi:MAG TPA: DUF2950 domain-containing protein [Syntrophorhabdales bacterium]|nr:DUF2950 domain-containing protein [Syntrophorhabdales bacterium]
MNSTTQRYHSPMEGKPMSTYTPLTARKQVSRFAAVIILCAISLFAFAFDHAYAAAPAQKTFNSPDDAAKALIAAAKSFDTKTLRAILGPGSKDLVSSGDPVADKTAAEQFVSHYEEKNRLQQVNNKKAVLYLGNDEWPFSIPIVKTGKKWRFDTKAGKQEILARRIGRNELSTIETCLVYVDAQHEYARKDRNENGLLEYAQKFRSEDGKKDGLYWESKEGEEESPLGPLVAEAVKTGYGLKQNSGQPVPYHGYYYRMLKAQGKHAPGGAYDYVVNGKMIGGFALVAYPAQYGNSGIMTFIVNQDGVVYQKNLGKNTAKITQAMDKFDPDDTWKKAQ